MRRLSLLFLLMALVQSCAVSPGMIRGGVVELVAGDHGHPVDVKLGQKITVRLDANRSTGYTWLLPEGEVAKGTLEALQTDSHYDRKIDGIYSVGVGAIEVWEFKAVRVGEGVLRLEYRRPFEPGVAPLQVMEFPLRVTAP